jgi:hypothetical protein
LPQNFKGIANLVQVAAETLTQKVKKALTKVSVLDNRKQLILTA